MKLNLLLKQPKSLAALSLVLMAVFAGIAMGYFYPLLKNASSVSSELLANKLLGFLLCFSLVILLDILVALAVYRTFRTNLNSLNLLAMILRLIYVVALIFSLKDLYYLSLGHDLINEDLSKALLFFNRIWSISLIVFGMHLFVLSKLVCTVKFGSKFLSFLLMLAGFMYIIQHSLNSFVPAYSSLKETVDMIIALPCAASELLFAYYLFISGFKTELSSDTAQ